VNPTSPGRENPRSPLRPLSDENVVTFDQIKRSFYFWYFQMQRVAEDVIRADDFAFIDHIGADWSPGHDPSEDLPRVKECIREQEHFEAALGYYRGQFDPTRFNRKILDVLRES
jgi:hypothetical protein